MKLDARFYLPELSAEDNIFINYQDKSWCLGNLETNGTDFRIPANYTDTIKSIRGNA